MQRPPTPEKDKVAGTRTSPRTLAKTNTSAPKKSQSAIEPARLVSILEKATPEEVTEMLQASFQQGGKASKVATKTSMRGRIRQAREGGTGTHIPFKAG
jgi:hypothetical protein